MSVTYIDNDYTFTAPLRAPRLILYQDVTHPSKQGTVKQAGKLKQAFASYRRDNMERFQDRGDVSPRTDVPLQIT